MLAYAHSRARSLAKFDSYAYTEVRRMRFTPNCKTSPGLAGPEGSAYEDYSVMKDTEEKSGKHCGKASRDRVLLQATVWEAGQCLSLF